MTPLRSGLWLAAAAVLGCGGDSGPRASAAAIRDSGGIALVENNVASLDRDLVVEDSATTDVGGSADEPVYDLNQVVGAAVLSDGRLVVANGSTSEVRWYDPSGRHLSSAGRRGSGPGEFQFLAGLWVTPGDSVLVVDAQMMRLTLFGPDGAVARTFTLGGQSGMFDPGEGRVSFAFPGGLFGDGTIFGSRQSFSMGEAREGVFRDTIAYLRYGADGTALDTLVRLPGPEMRRMTLTFMNQTMSLPTAVPLGRQTVVTAGGSHFYTATNDRPEIAVRDLSGALVRLIRIQTTPRSITSADVAAHRVELKEQLDNLPQMRMAPEPIRNQIQQQVEEAGYPETLPYIAELRVDPGGRLWAQEVGRPGNEVRRYLVFDPEGRLLERVAMPEGLQVTWIGEDAVVGIWRDEDQVEHVRVFRMRR